MVLKARLITLSFLLPTDPMHRKMKTQLKVAFFSLTVISRHGYYRSIAHRVRDDDRKKGLLMQKIVVEKPNKVKRVMRNMKNKIENAVLNLILLLPEKMIPEKVLNKYLDKRIAELQREEIKLKWDKLALDKALAEIKDK